MPKRKYYRYLSPVKKIKKKRPKNRAKRIFRLIFKGGMISLILAFFIVIAVFAYYAKDLPNPKEILQKPLTESTKIYDRTGKILLYEVYKEGKRTVVEIDEISPYLKQAVIAIEDNNFYKHPGIDLKGILRSIWVVIKTGGEEIQGASTITQQFIRNSLLTPKRTLARKIKEMILSLELERRYSKDEILAFYFNQISYGSNAYGVESASQTFFGKSAQDISLAEAAVLAALPKAPSRLSPYGNNLDLLKNRQALVLNSMESLGYISQEERKAALAQELSFQKQKETIKAPHFIMYVKELLEKEYGKEMVEKGGLRVITTLDWTLQEKAEEIVGLKSEENEKNYNAQNAALVAIDPKTGAVLTMVGSRDYFDVENDGNVNVTLRKRQPGSAFKPFVYAGAFKKGYPPESLLFDVKTEFNPYCVYSAVQAKDKFGLDCYHPRNYDLKERGPVTMRQALAQSLNIPSVKTLYLAGIDSSIELAKKMGITTLEDRSRFGLSLVLGGAEVKLLDITSAFGVFANDGLKVNPYSIIKVEDNKGEVLMEKEEAMPVRILESNVCRLINDILSDNEARAPMFGVSSPLSLGNIPAAAKTGTTQEYRDGWTIGYTPNLVAGVWTGNNDNTSMVKTAGVRTAGPIWHDFMLFALEDRKKLNFNPPTNLKTDKVVLNGGLGGETVKIDKISGKRATDLTPPELIEEKNYRQAHAILYYVDKDNPQGPVPQNAGQDPQFENWEQAIIGWAKNPDKGNWTDEIPPTEYDDIHTKENKPTIKIEEPDNGDILKKQTIKIETEVKANYSIKQVDFFLDGEFIGSKISKPFEWSFTPKQKDWLSGRHQITARAYDIYLNSQAAKVNIYTDISKTDKTKKPAQLNLTVEQRKKPPYKFTLKTSGSFEELKLYYSFRKDLSNSYLITKSWQENSQEENIFEWKADVSSGTYYVYALGEDEDENVVISNTIEIFVPEKETL